MPDTKPKLPLLPVEQVHGWGDQALVDALTWASSKRTGWMLTDARKADFSAGFQQGWRAAINTLQLQGYLAGWKA